ncbi:GmrSD restriction endonuclease domain-containing protein [Sphaerimonospora mesophila]|uniref:GmrSD restriction endonuclease domain-containing protein n=1 Tax=Sphaerimonospora mesophila TaxID=37483 RepID=UPI0009F81410
MVDSPIDGRGVTIRQLFTGRRFGLDFYQREYTWDREDVSALLEDLCNRFMASWQDTHDREQVDSYAPYFLGSFVCYKEGSTTFLVDGQQRITTLHLLLIHLRRLLLDQDLEDEATQLDQMICTLRHGKVTFTVDVPERAELLGALRQGVGLTLPSDTTISLSNLWARSQDLVEDFPDLLRGDALPYFHDWLLDRVCLVEIKALNRENAWEIFESMNDRGKRLDSIDLLKSFLLSESRSMYDELNALWRKMLARLTAMGRNTPSEFIKTLLLAQKADLVEGADDTKKIDFAFHEWVRESRDRLELRSSADFRNFIEWLTEMANRYRRLIEATRSLEAGLEPVFYNAANGLDAQIRLIMAAIRSSDDESVFIEKSRLIASYLDLLYVRKAVNNEPVAPSIFQSEADRLVPALRECDGPTDLSETLGKEISSLANFSAVDSYGLRPDNRRQVRYLLARMTAYVEEGCGRPNRIVEYLDEKRPYEIEHIWANHFERYQAEVKTYKKFESSRNRLGALLLLQKSDNASFGDDTYEQKLVYYFRQDCLTASLCIESYTRNPKFLSFIKAVGLTADFKAFPVRFGVDAIQSRQHLYRKLCERIWDPVKLGFNLSEAPSNDESVQRRKRAYYRVQVVDLITAGLIKPGAVLTANRGEDSYSATIDHDGRIRVPSGEVFASLSAAGRFVLDAGACPGWDFWKVETPNGPTPIKAVRNDALERGIISRK